MLLQQQQIQQPNTTITIWWSVPLVSRRPCLPNMRSPTYFRPEDSVRRDLASWWVLRHHHQRASVISESFAFENVSPSPRAICVSLTQWIRPFWKKYEFSWEGQSPLQPYLSPASKEGQPDHSLENLSLLSFTQSSAFLRQIKVGTGNWGAVQNSSIGDLVTDWLTDSWHGTLTFHIQRATLETSDQSDAETWPDKKYLPTYPPTYLPIDRSTSIREHNWGAILENCHSLWF